MRCRTAAASDRQQLAHRRQQRRCPTAMQAQQPHSDALQPAVTQQPSSGSSTNTSSSGSQQLLPLPRRALLAVAASTAAAAATAAGPAAASKLPEAFDKAWEGIGGGPADLVFPGGCFGRTDALVNRWSRWPSACFLAALRHLKTPSHPALLIEDFLGVWDVESVLTGVELPLGPEFVPDMRVGWTGAGGLWWNGAKPCRRIFRFAALLFGTACMPVGSCQFWRGHMWLPPHHCHM